MDEQITSTPFANMQAMAGIMQQNGLFSNQGTGAVNGDFFSVLLNQISESMNQAEGMQPFMEMMSNEFAAFGDSMTAAQTQGSSEEGQEFSGDMLPFPFFSETGESFSPEAVNKLLEIFAASQGEQMNALGEFQMPEDSDEAAQGAFEKMPEISSWKEFSQFFQANFQNSGEAAGFEDAENSELFASESTSSEKGELAKGLSVFEGMSFISGNDVELKVAEKQVSDANGLFADINQEETENAFKPVDSGSNWSLPELTQVQDQNSAEAYQPFLSDGMNLYMEKLLSSSEPFAKTSQNSLLEDQGRSGLSDFFASSDENVKTEAETSADMFMNMNDQTTEEDSAQRSVFDSSENDHDSLEVQFERALNKTEESEKAETLKHSNQARKNEAEEAKAIADQLIKSAKYQNTAEGGEFTLSLQPSYLGNLKVSVAIEGDTVVTRIAAQNSNTKNILNDNIDELKKAFDEAGIESGEIEIVNDGDDNSDFEFMQDSDSKAEQHKKKSSGFGDFFTSLEDEINAEAENMQPAGAAASVTETPDYNIDFLI